jgi:hypothetical protein
MSITPLERVTERVCRAGHPDNPLTPRPLLSLEDFFEGNSAVGSIGCNIPSATPQRFYSLLKELRARPEVSDIRVRVSAFDDPSWPFADTVFIMLNGAAEQVASWFPEELAPDDVWQGFCEGETYEQYEVPVGSTVVACWWD